MPNGTPGVSWWSTIAYVASLVVVFLFVAGLAYYVSKILGGRFGRAVSGGGRVLAAEALVAAPAVRNLIRTGRVAQLRGAILSGGAQGMQTMAQSVEGLLRAGKITREAAEAALADGDAFGEGR